MLDRISSLPDPIHRHILSFLPMKQAFQTQILSSQWRYKSYSHPILNFSSHNFDNDHDFMTFVDKIISHHDGTDIQKFSLKLSFGDKCIPADSVNAWISFAVQHNVCCMDLRSQLSEKFTSLPSSFFSCSTLSSLTLATPGAIKWQPFVKFPLLKSLYLQNVEFNDQKVTSTLFSSSACPILEHLTVNRCHMCENHTLFISIDTLTSLNLLSESDIYVNLSAARLMQIKYEFSFLPDISCETLSSLRDAYFRVSVSQNENRAGFAWKIITGLHNVESLSLSSGFIENLDRDQGFLQHMPSSHSCMKRLYLKILPTPTYVQLVANFLRSLQNLQKLCITFEEGHWNECGQSTELVVGDALECLKFVEIWGFEGRWNEFEIMKYLLMCATNLEKMEIGLAYNKKKGHTDNGKMIKDICLSYSKASPHATLLFWEVE